MGRLVIGVGIVWGLALADVATQRIVPIRPPEEVRHMGNVIKENDRVTVSLESNEVTIRGKQGFVDPVKVRLGASPYSPIKGTVAFETQRKDGTWEEIGYIKGAQDERHRGDPFNLTGEIEIFLRHHQPGVPDDQQFIRVMRFRWDGITLYVPVVGGAAVSHSRFYSDNGGLCWNHQDDGSIVLYDTHKSTDETMWTARWALRKNGVLEVFQKPVGV